MPFISAANNPYRVQRIEALLAFDPILANTSWDNLEKWAAARSGLIVGAKGSGKTTLLESLEQRLLHAGEEVKHWKLHLDAKHPHWLNEIHQWLQKTQGIAMVDSAGLVSFLDKKRLTQASKNYRIIASAHRPLRGWTTMLQLTPSPDLLMNLHERLDCGPIDPQRARALFKQNKGNLRDCFAQLYLEVNENPAT